MAEKIDIDHLANLSALELTDEQKVKFAQEFEGIMGLVEQINQAEVNSDIEYNPIDISDLRPDEVRQDFTQEEVLTNAPDKKQGCFAVPLMME